MGHQDATMEHLLIAHTVTQTSVSTADTPLELRIQKYGYLADGKQTKCLQLNSAASAVLRQPPPPHPQALYLCICQQHGKYLGLCASPHQSSGSEHCLL